MKEGVSQPSEKEEGGRKHAIKSGGAKPFFKSLFCGFIPN